MLGTDYCDLFVEVIRPRAAKLVELKDGTTVTIIRRPLKIPLSAKSLPVEPELPVRDGRESPKVKIANKMTIPPQSQSFVSVATGRHGLVFVQPI